MLKIGTKLYIASKGNGDDAIISTVLEEAMLMSSPLEEDASRRKREADSESEADGLSVYPPIKNIPEGCHSGEK